MRQNRDNGSDDQLHPATYRVHHRWRPALVGNVHDADGGGTVQHFDRQMMDETTPGEAKKDPSAWPWREPISSLTDLTGSEGWHAITSGAIVTSVTGVKSWTGS